MARQPITTDPVDLLEAPPRDDVVIDLRGPEPLVDIRLRPEAPSLFDRIGTTVRDDRWALVLLLTVLNVVDVITTRLVLAAGGVEGNPIMAPFVSQGIAAPLLIKLLGCGLVALIVARCPARSPIVTRALTIVTGVYVAIVSWNLAILLAS